MDKVKQRTLPTVHDFAVLLGFMSLVTVQLYSFSIDPGVGWHLKAGELILNGNFPFVDPFLAYVEPRAWVADQWLSDVLLWFSFKLGGFEFIYGLLSAVFISLYFWFCWSSLRKFTGLSLASTLAVLVCFKLSQIHFILRPVIFSFVLFAVLYFWLLFKSKEENRLVGKDYLFLFVAFLLWANLHPSFFLGFALLGLFVIDRTWRDKSPVTIVKYIPAGFVVLAATLINPFGWNLHLSVLHLGQSSYFMGLHQEWQPVDFAAYSGQVFALMMVVSLLGLVLSSRLKKCISFFSLLSFIIFTLLCFSAVRFLPYFGIIALVPFSLSLSAVGVSLRDTFKDRLPIVVGAFVWAEKHDRAYAFKQPLLKVVCLFLLLSPLFIGRIPFYSGDFGPPAKKFPYQETEFLKSVAATGAVVFAPPKWGGFVVFQSDLHLKPVLDDRNTLIGEALYQQYFALLDKEESLPQFLEENRVSYILTPINSKLDKRLGSSDIAEKLHAGKVASVYKVS